MPVTFYIPSYLRPFTDGQSEVQVNASAKKVGEALEALWEIYPGVRDRVVTEQSEVRQHVNIFVGEENIRDTGGLATGVKDGSEITIVPSVSGGIDTAIGKAGPSSPKRHQYVVSSSG